MTEPARVLRTDGTTPRRGPPSVVDMTPNPRPRPATLAVAAVLAAGALAACGNGLSGASDSSDRAIVAGPTATGSARPTPSGHATGSPTGSPTGPAGQQSVPTPTLAGSPVAQSPTPSTASPTPAPASSATCGPGELAVGLRTSRGGAAAGSRYELLTFRNTSTSTCTVDGHPGVSFVGGGNGTQLGVAAEQAGAAHVVRLAPGTSATALLRIANAYNYDAASCAPTTSDGFRVYPPDWRVSVFVPFRTDACQRDPGTGPQLLVSAVK